MGIALVLYSSTCVLILSYSIFARKSICNLASLPMINNEVHKDKLKFSLLDMLTRIDTLPVLPKNKLLLYQRYILSKLSWHLTVATLPKNWVIQHLDIVVTRSVRQWLDLPISTTLRGIILPKNQFGLNLQLPSAKFIQCQTVLRNALQSSQHDAITSLWKSTSQNMNVQYDSYKNTSMF